MDSSVSPKDEIWFLRVCHHISTDPYQSTLRNVTEERRSHLQRCARPEITLVYIWRMCHSVRLLSSINCTRPVGWDEVVTVDPNAGQQHCSRSPWFRDKVKFHGASLAEKQRCTARDGGVAWNRNSVDRLITRVEEYVFSKVSATLHS